MLRENQMSWIFIIASFLNIQYKKKKEKETLSLVNYSST